MSDVAPQVALSSGALRSADVRMRNGTPLLWRMLRKIVGASLVLSGAALMLMPSSVVDLSVGFSQQAIGLAIAALGAAAWLRAAGARRPDLEIDLRRGEIRLVRQDGGRRVLVEGAARARVSRA